jgi:hypothetical protein
MLHGGAINQEIGEVLGDYAGETNATANTIAVTFYWIFFFHLFFLNILSFISPHPILTKFRTCVNDSLR